MEIVKLSDLVKKAKINGLGEPIGGKKYITVTSPYMMKSFNSYSIKEKRSEYPFFLEWNDKDYVIQLGIDEDFKSLYLHAIQVNVKGKGIGTKLMNTILDHCDKNNLTIRLHAFPIECSKDPFKFNIKNIIPSYIRLKNWYQEFGFKLLSNGQMEYTPQNN